MIPITDRLRINDTDDELNWIVETLRTIKPKDGDPRKEWSNAGYYPTLRAAMIGAWNNHVNHLGKERQSLEGLLSAMAHAELAFVAAVENYAKEQKQREVAA